MIVRKWLNISADRTKEVWDNYIKQLKAMGHYHTCPKHGKYRCSWSICSIQRGTEKSTFHCHKCILKSRGQSQAESNKLKKLKTKQIQNKRAYRKKLSNRPTNKVARGIR